MSDWAKFCAISCTHCPFHSEEAVEKLLDELKGRDITHFIHLGDIVEGHASSQWKDDPALHSLYDEFLCASNLLKRIRKALPRNCELVALMETMMTTSRRQEEFNMTCVRYSIHEILKA